MTSIYVPFGHTVGHADRHLCNIWVSAYVSARENRRTRAEAIEDASAFLRALNLSTYTGDQVEETIRELEAGSGVFA